MVHESLSQAAERQSARQAQLSNEETYLASPDWLERISQALQQSRACVLSETMLNTVTTAQSNEHHATDPLASQSHAPGNLPLDIADWPCPQCTYQAPSFRLLRVHLSRVFAHLSMLASVAVWVSVFRMPLYLLHRLLRLLIHHELQLQSLQQDCKLHLYLRSGQRSFLPNLHGMATEWSRLRREEPQKIGSPLRVILLQAVLVEMDTRVQLALQKEKQAIIEMKWLTDMDAWTYMRWNAEKSQLELMEDQKPRPHESLLESIAELRTLVTPDSIKKFASLKGIPQGAPVGVDPLPAPEP
eukprot:s7586_g2.t2